MASVDFTDFLVLSDQFDKSGGWGQGDFDGNGLVEFPDFLTSGGQLWHCQGTGASGRCSRASKRQTSYCLRSSA